MRRKLAEKTKSESNATTIDEYVISVMGATGVGKSTEFLAESGPLRQEHAASQPHQPNSNSSSSDKTTIYEIPIVIGHPTASRESQRQVNAFGDYCAKFNFIREDYASRLDLSIDRTTGLSVTIGNGKKLTTVGTTFLPPFRFGDETESHSPLFHVIPKCLHNIILGRSFLKMTNTFSTLANFARRVKERVLHGITHHHFLYLGESMPRFSGLVNGKPQEALADSGAKVLVIDEDFAQKNHMIINHGSRTTLRFADESTAETSGMVHGVQWEFGSGGHGTHTLDFHVLRNAPADVILSDSFLFGNNAFSQYNCYLVDDDEDDDDAFFFAIDVDKRHHCPGTTNSTSASQTKHIELVYRGEKDDEILRLPLNEQAAAQAKEKDRRADWDRNFARHQQAQLPHPSNGSSTATPSTATTWSASQPSPGMCQQKSSRRWFKLKRKSSPSS
ncbi:hypothetical protein K458DRAFT_355739 [Lentithecium fluviatile CBS 122367]|uniref:Uncharacterized protein n=1 Tax=Lentithecium fluviatile CBS 122367 TaxID=1168545 RepID=A0A6G1JLZ8_9PLEO|nr:hypothetical protein K458DRAFT_355739 [Lentithecium fluviatile CBS 122367]